MSRLYNTLIKLAHQEPTVRKDLVPVLRKYAMEFPTLNAYKSYLKQHPKADPKKHSVEGKKPKSLIQAWKPDANTFRKTVRRVKDFVVGEIKGEYNYYKEAGGAVMRLIKNRNMSPKDRRAAARVALTESLAVVRNVALTALFPGLGAVAALGIKTAVSAATSLAVKRSLVRVFPSPKHKKASEKELSEKDITNIIQEEFEKALDEEFAQFDPDKKKS